MLMQKTTQTKLTKEQKETVGLLSIGTCLEMFDLFLYIHMAVLLDQIFFSKDDQQSWILSNIAICSAFVLKPIGGAVLGWLGDKIGRTFVIFISTFFTGVTCVIISILPTYDKIGIIASFVIVLCRLIQGIMATGEFYSADIYITETIPDPKNRYSMGVLLCIGSWVGGKFLATALVSITLFCVDNGVTEAWRVAFLCGGFIACIGMYARRILHETNSFTEAKKLEKALQTKHKQGVLKDKIPKLSLFYYLILSIGNILFGLFPFTYCKDLLVNMGYSSSAIAFQSFCVGVFFTINLIGYFFLVRFVCPLKIIKYRSYASIFTLLFVPYLIQNASSNLDILVLQCLVVCFSITSLPASPIIYKLFPLLLRSRMVLIPNAMSSAFGFIFLNFSIPVLSKYFFQYTFLILALPIAIISIFGIQHFQKAHQNRINNHNIVGS
jgi:MFS transporter, MHS family, proline/betaine transporter